METLIFFLFSLYLNLIPSAQAEYRAYRLNIINSVTGIQRSVTTNFDPIQYRDLYPILAEEEITLEKSWMCYGDTSQKEICGDPDSEETLPKSDLN